jgi:hypothetical protein
MIVGVLDDNAALEDNIQILRLLPENKRPHSEN